MKLYSTPRAIAYLERHPDAVFETEHLGSVVVLYLQVGTLWCSFKDGFGHGGINVPMSAQWRLVSPKPKRDRVYLGTATVSYNDVLGGSGRLCSALRDLPDGIWTIYAVKKET